MSKPFHVIATPDENGYTEAVLDAEVRIGELMAKVPKAVNQYKSATDQYKSATDSAVASTKTEVIEKAGFTPKQVQRFEALAAHPEIVEQAKAKARENEDIVLSTSLH